MAEIIGESNWSPVRQLETHELARGGLNGNMNEQAKALVERTNFLKENSATKEDLATVAGGNYGFNTLAEFEAFKSSIPANSTVTIAEAGPYQGENIWDGTTLTKSPYDPLSQAKADATNKAKTAENNAVQHTNNLVGQNLSQGTYAIVEDILKKSPLWIQNGYLGFTFLELLTLLRVKSQLGLNGLISQRIVPFHEDINRKCGAWLEDGLFRCAGVHPSVVGMIKDQLGPISGTPNNVTKAAYPIVSDGASLRQWKAKVATLKYGSVKQPRLLITGDSWIDYATIPDKLLNLLRTYLGKAGTGWINLGDPNAQYDSISVGKAGIWAFEDLNNIPSFTYSSAPDGYALISSTVDSTLSIGNLREGDQLTVFFGKTDGTFKYTINNGAETTVTASSTGAEIQSVVIPIVSPPNNIVFTLTAGTIAFYGLHLRKTTGSGVEVTKIGNAGATGKDYLKISAASRAYFSDYLKPDLVMIILGTNDYRIDGNTAVTYKNGISAMIDGYRVNNPNCGVILVAPARTNGVAVTPLSTYRDAVYELAQSKQCEFYNMYDDWDTYAIENANTQWADNLHTSHFGAQRFAQKIFKSFLEI